MYVATLALPGLNWLIRIDVEDTDQGPMASYVRVDEHGTPEGYTVPIGPDLHRIGLPAISIVDLVHDLNWNGVDGLVSVVHRGAIDQAGLETILAGLRPVYELRNAMTTSTVQ